MGAGCLASRKPLGLRVRGNSSSRTRRRSAPSCPRLWGTGATQPRCLPRGPWGLSSGRVYRAPPFAAAAAFRAGMCWTATGPHSAGCVHVHVTRPATRPATGPTFCRRGGDGGQAQRKAASRKPRRTGMARGGAEAWASRSTQGERRRRWRDNCRRGSPALLSSSFFGWTDYQ